jgi:hypothetical protein
VAFLVLELEACSFTPGISIGLGFGVKYGIDSIPWDSSKELIVMGDLGEEIRTKVGGIILTSNLVRNRLRNADELASYFSTLSSCWPLLFPKVYSCSFSLFSHVLCAPSSVNNSMALLLVILPRDLPSLEGSTIETFFFHFEGILLGVSSFDCIFEILVGSLGLVIVSSPYN